jgi:type I restriction enzyme R subunit
MTKSEAQTRKEIIDKRLKLAGWNIGNPLHVTQELDIWVGLPQGVREPETPYQGHLFADYALLSKEGKPIAVVEAKKTIKRPSTLALNHFHPRGGSINFLCRE